MLLIYPPFLRGRMGRIVNRLYPPLGLLYISAVLKNNGFSVKVYNADFQKKIARVKDELIYTKKVSSLYKESLKHPNTTWKEIRKTIENEHPDIVGIGFETVQYKSAIKIAKIVKSINEKIPIIVGGTHPTIQPIRTIKEPYFDILVKGEGEHTMLELINSLGNGIDLKHVRGILFKKDKNIVVTSPRPFIKNLDSLPFPARDTLINDYPAYGMGQLITSRGCPYNCAFCCNVTKWRGTVRFRSPKNVVEEIEEVYYRYNTREFRFIDDTSTLNKKRVYEICNLLKKKKLDITWSCGTRVDSLDKELIRKMRSSGCYLIWFGVESGNQYILNRMRKRITLNQVRKAVNLCKKEGIIVVTSFMIGYPGETKDTLENTIDFIRELDPDSIEVALFATPFPGTDLRKSIERTDLLSDDFCSGYGLFTPMIRLKSINQKELWNYYERMHRNQMSIKRKLRILIKKIKGPYFMPKLKEKILSTI